MSEVDETRAARSYWIEVILLAVAASVSYLVLPLLGPLLCLVPLQALLIRRGIAAFGYAAALFGIAAVSFRLLTGWGDLPEQIGDGLMRAEILVLILTVGGLYVFGIGTLQAVPRAVPADRRYRGGRRGHHAPDGGIPGDRQPGGRVTPDELGLQRFRVAGRRAGHRRDDGRTATWPPRSGRLPPASCAATC